MMNPKTLPAYYRSFANVICLLALLSLPALALEKKDVLGFWILDMEQGAVSVRAETFFADNGNFEMRGHSEILGEFQDVHGRGTWIIKGDFLHLNGGLCMEDDGSGIVPCKVDDDEPRDSIRVAGTGAARELILIDEDGETEFGKYSGAARQFSLRDMLTPSALARNALRPNGRVEKGAGTAAIQGLRGIDIFDMRGRNLGSLPR